MPQNCAQEQHRRIRNPLPANEQRPSEVLRGMLPQHAAHGRACGNLRHTPTLPTSTTSYYATLLRGQQRFQWLRQFLFIKRLSRAGARGKAEPQATLHPLLQRGEKPSPRVYWSSHSPCYLRLYNSDSDMQPCITGSEMHLKFVTTNIPVLRESFQHSCLFSALKQERTQTAATPRRTRP